MTRVLSVLQVVPELELGGVERGTLEVAEALVRAGHHSTVMSGGGRLVSELVAAGSTHLSLAVGRKSPFAPLLVRVLRRHLERRRFDVVHVRSRLPAWLVHLALRRLNGPRPVLISTLHAPYEVNFYSRIMVRSDRIIAVSNFIRDYVLSHFPETDPARLSVIHNGVSLQQFPRGFQPDTAWRQQWEQEWPELSGKMLIALPGRISRWKGHEDLIALLERLLPVCPQAHGLVIGDAHKSRRGFLRHLHRRIRERGLESHISFVGARRDICQIMAISRVVLSLSRAPEAFGRVALEALSLGVPVVAYDHGGAAEILSRLQPAGLVPIADVAAATQTIATFLAQPPPIRENTAFVLEDLLQQTLALYNEQVRT